MAKGGQGRLVARGRPDPGTQGQAGPGLDLGPALGFPGPGRPLAMSHEPPLASLGHEP